MTYRPRWLLTTALVMLPIAPAMATDFQLPDVRTGKVVAFGDFADKKAVAVVFLSTVCPVNNAYLHRLNELQAEYGPKGVQIIGVNANHADTLVEIVEHAKKFELSFPVLRDEGQKFADALGAKRNPEVFVLDAQGKVRYKGRIDDQYTVDVKKLAATTRELADAFDAVVAGKEIAVAEMPASGCLISRAPKPKPTAEVTYFKHIAPLIQKHCQECHRPGQIGPMPFLTYDDVAGWSEMIREVVSDRRMPPWYADPKFGHFKNDRRMPDAELQTLIKWIDEGCPKGDPKDAPPPVSYPDVWKIGKPDLILSMDEEFAVPAKMPERGVPYQLFFIETGFKEDMWVQMAEARAGSPEVVHHVLAFIAPPPDKIDPTMPDFPFLPGVKNARVLCGTAPGDMPTMFPDELGIRIPAGSTIVLQLHYTPNGKATKDRSSIGLRFSKKKPTREVITVPVFNGRWRIPPGDSNFRIESMFTFREDAEIYSFMPHMHVRGKDFRINLIDPQGKETTALSVPRYNFNWQNVYRCAEPIRVQKGTKVHCIAHYDNSPGNPLNPDPTKAVGWGDQTWQEMMIGWMDMAYDRLPD